MEAGFVRNDADIFALKINFLIFRRMNLTFLDELTFCLFRLNFALVCFFSLRANTSIVGNRFTLNVDLRGVRLVGDAAILGCLLLLLLLLAVVGRLDVSRTVEGLLHNIKKYGRT